MKTLHIKSGDQVQIISGRSTGAQGKVVAVSPSEGKVIIEGANLVTKHVKPRRQGETGGIVKAEGSLYACKVMLVCPTCKKPVRVGYRVEDGKKVRFCVKCKTVL